MTTATTVTTTSQPDDRAAGALEFLKLLLQIPAEERADVMRELQAVQAQYIATQ